MALHRGAGGGGEGRPGQQAQGRKLGLSSVKCTLDTKGGWWPLGGGLS